MTEQANSSPVPDYILEPVESPQTIRLELDIEQANALHQWLLKSMHEGETALDDALVSAAIQRLSQEIEFVSTVSAVREELEAVGLDTADLDDEGVAELAQRIRDANGARAR